MNKDETVKRGRGRPKGSRSKSKLILAQMQIDDAAGLAVDTLVALMKNDKAYLGITDDVSPTLRFNVSKTILDKAIANEKDKESALGGEKPVVGTMAPSAPKVFSVAK